MQEDFNPHIQLNLMLGISSLAVKHASSPPLPRAGLENAGETAGGHLMQTAAEDADMQTVHAEELLTRQMRQEDLVAPEMATEIQLQQMASMCPPTQVECPSHVLLLHGTEEVTAYADVECRAPTADTARALIPETRVLPTLLLPQSITMQPTVPNSVPVEEQHAAGEELRMFCPPSQGAAAGGAPQHHQCLVQSKDVAPQQQGTGATVPDASQLPSSLVPEPEVQPAQDSAEEAAAAMQDFVHEAEGTQRSAQAADLISGFNMALHEGRVEGALFHCIQGADLDAAATALFHKKAKRIAEVVWLTSSLAKRIMRRAAVVLHCLHVSA
jgi:hypothetical protein